MLNQKKPYSLHQTLTMSVQVLRLLSRKGWLFLFIGVFVPNMVSMITLDHMSLDTGRDIQLMVSNSLPTIQNLFMSIWPYLRIFVGINIFAGLISVVFYFAFLELIIATIRQIPNPPIKTILVSAVRWTIPRGLVFFALLGLIMGIFGQLFGLAFGALLLMVPVILVIERQGLWRSIVSALRLRYINKNNFVGPIAFSVLGSLGTLLASVYLIQALSQLLVHQSLNLDGLSSNLSSFVYQNIYGSTINLAYTVGQIVRILIEMILSAWVATFSASLYFLVAGSRDIASA